MAQRASRRGQRLTAGRVAAAARWCRGGAALVLCLVAWWFGPGVAGAEEPLAFRLDWHQTPARLCPGEGRLVTLAVENRGTLTWRPDERDRLGYHWMDEHGGLVVRDGRRTHLPHAVRPGQRVELMATLVAPEVEGAYALRWAMVREEVAWHDPAPPIPVQVAGDGPAFAYTVVEHDVPPTLPAHVELRVRVRLRNDGCATWSGRTGDALAYHWYDGDGALVEWEGARTPLPDVAPGETVDVWAVVHLPSRPGPHHLVFEPVREHVRWFGPSEASPAIAVEAVEPALAWALVGGAEPPMLHASEVVEVPLVLRNEGEETWSDETGDRLSYRWLDLDGRVVVSDGSRTSLPEAVDPGEEIELRARLQAPAEPGRYRLQWEPVREGKAWFGRPLWSVVTEPQVVTVGASRLAWSVVEANVPSVIAAGRTRTMTVVLRNEGADAWSPATGDHVSYRWKDRDGNVVVAEGRRSGLPREVAPGDTVEVEARVRGPTDGGPHELEIAMVREHVRWFGAPVQGTGVYGVRVIELPPWLVMGMFALSVGAVAATRRGSDRVRSIVAEGAWPAWTGAAIVVATETFGDLADLPPWDGSWTMIGSVAALMGAGVATVPPRGRPFAGMVVVGLVVLLGIADLGYLHFFGSIVPLSATVAAHHLLDAGATVGSLLEGSQGWLVAIAFSGIPLLGMRVPAVGLRGRARAVLPVTSLLLAMPAVVRLGSDLGGERGVRIFSEQDNVQRFGYVGTHLFQLGRAVRDMGGPAPLSPAEREEIEAWVDRRERPADDAFGVARGMNVVLIQVEALQAWVVGARVDGQEVTPFLNRAAETGLRFSAIFDQTAQGRTSDAEHLVLASGHALEAGALSFLRKDNRFVTVAHALAGAGYTTLSAHPYARGFWNRAVLHPRYGFETSLFRRELGSGAVVGWGLSDETFLQRMAERLASVREPFFAFLITLSLHHPYEKFPPALEVLDMGGLQGTPLGNYLHAMHHFDAALEQFFADLEASGLGERTVVMVYGDHVTGLPETPEMLRLAGIEQWDPSVPVRLHRVPVALWIPGAGLMGQRDRVGGQIDLGPTLLHVLGIETPRSFVGRSLLGSDPGFAALPDGGAIAEDRMFVRKGSDIPREGACFDRPTGTTRPRTDCEELAARAEHELRISRWILDHDLAAELAGE